MERLGSVGRWSPRPKGGGGRRKRLLLRSEDQEGEQGTRECRIVSTSLSNSFMLLSTRQTTAVFHNGPLPSPPSTPMTDLLKTEAEREREKKLKVFASFPSYHEDELSDSAGFTFHYPSGKHGLEEKKKKAK